MKNIKYALAFILSFALLSACEKSKTNVELGNEGQILHIANGDEPRELDPQLSTGTVEHAIHMALYEGLTKKNPKTLEVEPALAKSWTISEDGLTYTFNLREEALWSNGDAITADQILWSWQRSLMPNFTSEWAYMKFFIKNAEPFYNGDISDFSEVGVKALDRHTLEVTLNNRTNFFLQLLDHPSYFPVHPPTILAHAEMDQAISKWTLPQNWVGNGPFTLESWSVNEEIAVEKNPNYWDADEIRLRGIHFYPIQDKQAEERAYRSGQVHLTYTPQLAIEKIAQYQEKNPKSLRITNTYASYYYIINVTKPPMNDVRVRQALAMAIDRQLLTERVTKAGERPAYSLVPSDPEGYIPEQLFEFNPKKAKQLLADAGYPNGEGLPEIELLYNTNDNHRKVAVAIQQMLAQTLGVRVTLTNQEWKVYLNSKKSLDYQVARAGWIADYMDPSNFFEIYLSFSGNNDTGWKNEEYDALVQTLKETSDTSERHAIFSRLNAILVEEMPIIPLYLFSDVNLVAPEVKGWYDNVLHHHPYNRVYLEVSN